MIRIGTLSKPRSTRPSLPKCFVGLALAGTLLAAEAAEACNNVRIRNLAGRVDWQGGSGTGYEVFDSTQIVQSVTFNVRKRGPTGCDYFVAVTTGGSGTYDRTLTRSGDSMSYNLYTTASRTTVLKDLPEATASEVVVGSFSGSGTQTNSHTVYYYIPPQQVVPSKQYRDTVQFKAYQGTLASNTLEQSKNVRMRAQVLEVVELSIVDQGGPFDSLDTVQALNFGTLTQNETGVFDVLVRSNAGYDITFQSDNSGVLKISHPSDTSTVSYSVDLAGSSVDLSSGQAVNVASTSGVTTASGDRLAATITIGAIDGASAGTYSDNIAVVVSAK